MEKSRLLAIVIFLLLMQSPSTPAANVLRMTISKSHLELDVLGYDLGANLLNRATITETIFNNMTGVAAYLANIKVGSPGQAISLVIDTGSSDTFVLAITNDQCTDSEVIYNYGPCIGGTFDSSASNTFKTVTRGGFNIKYVDQLGSSGDYISDNFEIGGFSIKGLQMGLALHSTVGVGIMGIGYRAGEYVSPENRYPNLIDQLVAQNLVNVKAYSLYLDDKETSTGSVLFGGIDTEKFVGTLRALPVLKDPQTQLTQSFTVMLRSLSMTDQFGQTSPFDNAIFPLPVLLDSGTTLIYLPVHLLDAFISGLGAIDDTSNSKLIFVDCDWRITRANKFLNFGFGDSGEPVIHVPLSELIRSLRGKYPISPFKNTCDLGIRASNSIFILGDTFLRSAYVVYDIDHDQIALAQANFEATGSNIYEIPSSATGIPLLSGKATGMTKVPQSHFITRDAFSSTETPAPLDTVSHVSTEGIGSASGTGRATSNSTSSSPTKQQTGPSATSITSKSKATITVPTFRISSLVIFYILILVELVSRPWRLAL